MLPVGDSSVANEELIGRRLALISMSIGVMLAVAKILVGIQVGSTSVTSDGLEAAGDALRGSELQGGERRLEKDGCGERIQGVGLQVRALMERGNAMPENG